MNSLWENPIFLRSRRVAARALGSGPKAWLSRYGGGLLILLGPLGCYLFFGFESVLRDPWGWPRQVLGPILGFSAFLLVLYTVTRALNGTFSAISLEKEQKTYDSLLSTLLTSSDVVGGKLAAGLWPIVRELLVVSPLGVALGALAGYPLQALLFMGLCGCCALLFGMIGLWASYSSPTSPLANRKGTGLTAALLIGGPLVDWFLHVISYRSGADFQPVFTALSPLAAASSISNGSPLWMATFLLYLGVAWGLSVHLRRLAQTARLG